jgi:mRNA interferase MazF
VVPSQAGAIVLLPFPFSDLTQAKLRPAVALTSAGRGDWILCQVTSNPYGDADAIGLTPESFLTGSLRVRSYARPLKLFTANARLVVGQAGLLRTEVRRQIADVLIARLLQG